MTAFDDFFILARRPYRETSMLVEGFCAERGRTTFVARGARKKGAGNFEPFAPLKVMLSRHRLPFCQKIEPSGAPTILMGKLLFAGLYLNELVSLTLSYDEPVPDLFKDYRRALEGLNSDPHLALRQFEYSLLCALGYGFDWNTTLDGDAVHQEGRYRSVPQAGILEDINGELKGSTLLAMSQGQLLEADRNAIAQLLFSNLKCHLRREMNTKQWFK